MISVETKGEPMCLVIKGSEFDATVHALEMDIPEAHDAVFGLKWKLERGAAVGEYLSYLDMYLVTLDKIQVFYAKEEPDGEPAVIKLIAARKRPD